jgi:hypothetical protein
MPKTPQQELDEFISTKPSWMKKALRLEHSSFTTEENIEWINHLDNLWLNEQEYRRILRKIPAKWKGYCKKVKRQTEQLQKLERKLLDLPKGLAGAPRTDGITLYAITLQRRKKLNIGQIADKLSKRYKKTILPEAVRKRIERFNARTKADE